MFLSAEDGVRGLNVTGVQTCVIAIWCVCWLSWRCFDVRWGVLCYQSLEFCGRSYEFIERSDEFTGWRHEFIEHGHEFTERSHEFNERSHEFNEHSHED